MRSYIIPSFLCYATALGLVLPRSDNATTSTTLGPDDGNSTVLSTEIGCTPDNVGPVNAFIATGTQGRGVAWYNQPTSGDNQVHVYQMGWLQRNMLQSDYIIHDFDKTFELTSLASTNDHTEAVIECSKKCYDTSGCRTINVYTAGKDVDGKCQAVWKCRTSTKAFDKVFEMKAKEPAWNSVGYDLSVAGKAYTTNQGTNGCKSDQASVAAEAWWISSTIWISVVLVE